MNPITTHEEGFAIAPFEIVTKLERNNLQLALWTPWPAVRERAVQLANANRSRENAMLALP